MKASHTLFRRAALSIALGACLSTMAPVVLAQSATGSVAGRANAGDQITITTQPAKSVQYRWIRCQLSTAPAGRQLRRAGDPHGTGRWASRSRESAAGRHHDRHLGSDGGVANMAAIQVVGSRVVNRVDVRSTESATNIRREELARLPVDQSLASVALLAPGVVASGATFGGLTFSGSSVAENSVYINGLNVTDHYRARVSSVPFGFSRNSRSRPAAIRRVRPNHRFAQRGTRSGSKRSSDASSPWNPRPGPLRARTATTPTAPSTSETA